VYGFGARDSELIKAMPSESFASMIAWRKEPGPYRWYWDGGRGGQTGDRDRISAPTTTRGVVPDAVRHNLAVATGGKPAKKLRRRQAKKKREKVLTPAQALQHIRK